ncbi:ribosome biogenesis GTP-binding protein YihA/YsxC [Phreatobacter oligotrophus]|uniref:ribosome biogenesis GTP-binding protein YihA/YsxC n=1 Tax=Phreatobacter oligotrophus TaxID=1122261 RepID=UPI0023570E59|nr:ribosome biogenesis GTP-binding protein YihA/YsxC [Phreatobacter oligotrophus]MBX9993086.1 ribosome biogenesis GTP-binding protein YihA/YsxC [Phreatobacter oligotrophus]
MADDAIEVGRKLFARPWTFWRGTPDMKHLPPMTGVEIAFAGRSNVGKSSLINALVGQNQLARTSNTPGRTQELNFFHVPSEAGPGTGLVVVDMPGYGFAAAPEAKVKAWTKVIHDYLRGRQNLARVYVLIDARHGIKPVDVEVLDELGKAAVSYQIVLTKADQISPTALDKLIATTLESLKKRAAAFPEIIATSSRKGEGIPELRAAIARVAAERA